MENISSLQHRRSAALISPAPLRSSLLPLTRPFAPPSHASSPFSGDLAENLEHARRFGYSFERISLHRPDLEKVERHEMLGETTSQLTSPTGEDRSPGTKQGSWLQTAHESSLVTMPSGSVPVVQRILAASGTPDSPSLPVDSQKHTRRSGWSFEHIATTRDDLELASRKENTTGLPDHLKTGVEALSGLSLDDVRVHYNSSQPAGVGALAYTQGTEIYVGPGQEQHLAHEAWHVAQQKQGRVKPTLQAEGMLISEDQELEREAESIGKKALSIQSMVNITGESLTGQRVALNDGVQQGKDKQGEVLQRVKSDVGWSYQKKSKIPEWPLSSEGEPPNLGGADPIFSLRFIGAMMGRNDDFMRAHLKPQKWGGKGGMDNIRPWPKSFEENEWNTKVDQPMDKFYKDMAIGGTFAAIVCWQENEGTTEKWIAPLLAKFPGQRGSETQLAAQKLLYDAILLNCKLIPEAASADWWEVVGGSEAAIVGEEFHNIYPPMPAITLTEKVREVLKIYGWEDDPML